MKRVWMWMLCVLLGVALLSLGGASLASAGQLEIIIIDDLEDPTPSPSPTPSPRPTATATARPTATATARPTATATARPTATPTASPSPSPSPTATATASPSPAASATPEVPEMPEEAEGEAPLITESAPLAIVMPDDQAGWAAQVREYAVEEAEALGLAYALHTASNLAEMSRIIDQLTELGVEVMLVYSPWEGIDVPMEVAAARGVKAIRFNQKVTTPGIYSVLGDNEAMGEAAAATIVEQLEGEGSVLILNAASATAIERGRMNGFTAVLADAAGLTRLGTYSIEATPEISREFMKVLLGAESTINAVFTVDDAIAVGVLEAIDEMGRTDIKVLASCGGREDFIAQMAEHDAIYLQTSLYDAGAVREAVSVAAQLLDGETVEYTTVLPVEQVTTDTYEAYLSEEH